MFHKPLVEAMGVMMCYDLIVVDEAPQLFEEHFSRLHEMWRAARCGGQPAKYRVWFSPGTSGSSHRRTTPSENLVNHPGWRLVHKIELHKVWRQADGDPLFLGI